MPWDWMEMCWNNMKVHWRCFVVRLPPLAGVCPTSSSSRMFCSHPQNTSAPLRVFAVPLFHWYVRVLCLHMFTWFMCFVSFKNVESSSVHWIQAMEVDIAGRDLASLALRSWLSVMNIIYSSFTHHLILLTQPDLISDADSDPGCA